ncbi:MAG: hypothetical protein ACN6OB_13940 [Chryseobacterium jejuense]|uniref:hypothetical protein n=1 Tax=Chryseobacterium jejuense TaxID=445960 RepID=UPI003D0E8639
MTNKELKQIIRSSGKRGVVSYRGKGTRKEFDESFSQNKINVISNFIGDKMEEITKILKS